MSHHASTRISLPDYLAPSISKSLQRYLTLHILLFTRVLLRILLPLLIGGFSLVHFIWTSHHRSYFIGYHILAVSLALLVVHVVASLVPLFWMGWMEMRERMQRLEFFRVYVSMNDLYEGEKRQDTSIEEMHSQMTNGDPFPINTDDEESTSSSQHAMGQGKRQWKQSVFDDENHPSDQASSFSNARIVPKQGLRLGPFRFDSKMWAIYVPIIVELIVTTVFSMSLALHLFFINIISTESALWYRIIFAFLPLLLGSVFVVLSHSCKPFDIMWTLEMNDRMVFYNSHGLVLHNRCLEQFERDIEYGGAFVEKWEPCALHNRAVVLFDAIRDVSIGTSLENAPFSNAHPINFPWLYVCTVNNIGKEYRVILPIRLEASKHMNYTFLRSTSKVGRFVSYLARHWIFFRLSPIYDGLDKEETIELLRCIQERRPDLFDKLDFVIEELREQVNNVHGYQTKS